MPIFPRGILAAGCVAVLLSISGCRTVARQSSAPSSHAQSASRIFPADLTASDDGIKADHTAPLSDSSAADSNPAAVVTEEDVTTVLRNCGGILRPNETGDIVEIDLSFSKISDAQLSGITVFPELAELNLTGTEIHDNSLQSLLELKNLRALKLKGTNITNEGLKLLSRIPALILLDASNTAVSDDGLVDAGQWTNLRYLSMNNTTVSDAGLQYLESLGELKGLSVIHTAVTEAGVLSLKQKLPNCLIVAQTEITQTRVETTDSIPRLPSPDNIGATDFGAASGQQLAQVIQLAGQQPRLAVHLSKIYSSCGHWPETVQILETACAADPNDSGIHTALGEALARTGNPEEALQHFEQSFVESEARFMVGMIMYENTLKTCERYFDDVLRADPSLNVAHLQRDRIHQELAALQVRRRAPVSGVVSEPVPEIVPAPRVKTVSRSRQLSPGQLSER